MISCQIIFVNDYGFCEMGWCINIGMCLYNKSIVSIANTVWINLAVKAQSSIITRYFVAIVIYSFRKLYVSFTINLNIHNQPLIKPMYVHTL